MSRATSGKRLSYEIHEVEGGEIYVSRKIFTDAAGTKMCRVHIDKSDMTFKIVDAVTGAAYVQGGENISNEEVVFRAAKRELKKLLGVDFEKETRKVKSKTESNG